MNSLLSSLQEQQAELMAIMRSQQRSMDKLQSDNVVLQEQVERLTPEKERLSSPVSKFRLSEPAAARTGIQSMASGHFQLGVDVGGTFTDLLLLDHEGNIAAKAKTPSTPADPSQGISNGMKKVCELANIRMSQIKSVFHGTTVATNAILEGKGSKCALIVTTGYRQVLHIDRSFVPGGLGGWITWNPTPPLAPLEATFEVDGRMDAFGNEVRELDVAALSNIAEQLKAMDVDTITICFLNSYTNGAHEEQARSAIQRLLPGVPISISSEVLPEMYEYERALTTVANSYIRPNVEQYLENLQGQLGDSIMLRILRSDGGLCSQHNATQFPVNLLMSGPAGGVAGVVWVAKHAGYRKLLTLDMGGTSTDVALIYDGEAKTRKETRVGDMVVRARSLDVQTVGAGGGSIAHVPNLTKALRVGPQSAGARPGPACYGHGGEAPTVTDANVVLGYLPSALLGGEMRLDVKAASTAVDTVASALGLSEFECASGIYRIVNENMVGALRKVSVEKGVDPREFCLCSFGGAGSLHANAIAVVMNTWPVIVPPSPGLLCAYGDVSTCMRASSSISFMASLAATSVGDFADKLHELESAASSSLELDGVPRSMHETRWEVDMRYKGQGLTLTITVHPQELERRSRGGRSGALDWLAAAFDDEHEARFHFKFDTSKGCRHEIVNLRAVVQSTAKEVEPPLATRSSSGTDARRARVGQQPMYFAGEGGSEAITTTGGIYERDALCAGHVVSGPAIILEMDSTTLVLPDHHATVDKFGNLVITPSSTQLRSSGRVPPANSFSSRSGRRGAVEVDVVTLDIIENALRHARYEMDSVVYRTAMSPGIREQHDQFPMICNAGGKMVVGQFGSFIHGFLANYNKPVEDGDIILLSDPYSCDGAISHANDWMVLTPIYHSADDGDGESKLVGWAAMFGHTTDAGGKTPCSMPNDARTIYEEAIVIPPVKLYARGELNSEMLDLVLHNCRKPMWNRCDLLALVASIKVARSRVVEFCDRFGQDTYCEALEMMLERNKKAMAELIRTAVPNDKLYFEDYICDDAMGKGPYKLCCHMWKEGDDSRVIFDFEGTDPQSDGSVNFYLNEDMFRMFCGAYMITVFDPQIIFNDGFYDLVDVRIPEGSLLKPRKPAALSCRTHALGRIFDILGGLLGQRSPNFMCAAGFSDSPHFMYSGRRVFTDGNNMPNEWLGNGGGTVTRPEQIDEDDRWFQLYSISFGGIPGRPFGDGPDGHSLWPSFTNVPNEFLEKYMPLRVERCETIADSGGAGLFRGGNGIRQVFRFLEAGEISIHDDRWLTSPWGVNGGTPGQRSTKLLYRDVFEGEDTSATMEVVPSKCDNVRVNAGDVLHYITWGGGGWGNPLEREPATVLKDVLKGLVTAAGAERYGVVISSNKRSGAFSVDERATTALRAEMAAATGEPKLFDFGFREGIKATPAELDALLGDCLDATGMPPPRLPFSDDGDLYGGGIGGGAGCCGVGGRQDSFELFSASAAKPGQQRGRTSRLAAKAAPAPQLKLDGKVCLVTGSSSGIGKGIVMAYAKEGANVVVNYRSGDTNQRANAVEIAETIAAMGCDALVAPCDVSKEPEVQRLVTKTIETFGRIDVLVNNAGIATIAPIDKLTPAMWDQLISVNLRSVFLCTHTVLPHMYRQGAGKIINTASQLAYKGAPGLAHYCAAKGAILSFTRSLALEIGNRNINANCVGPGATMTPMLEDVDNSILDAIKAAIPRGKFAEIDDITPTYVFLASDDSQHYQGQCLSPNGGDAFL